ncbi:transcriptional regulator, partial [Bacillus cereus]|nr:transcriptional regulator [Bacillus cereus]
CISNALQFNNDDTDYLYDLAFTTNSESTSPQKNQPKRSPSLIRIRYELTYCPTIITYLHCHILDWNPAAANVFLDYEQI